MTDIDKHTTNTKKVNNFDAYYDNCVNDISSNQIVLANCTSVSVTVNHDLRQIIPKKENRFVEAIA